MGSLSNLSPAATYGDLLQINAGGLGLQTTPSNVQDGLGNNTVMTLWTTGVNFSRTGPNQFQLDGVALTASAATLNNLSSLANANYLLTTPNSQLSSALVLTSAAGISLTTSAGNYVIAPASELAGLQSITGTGLMVRAGSGVYQTDTLTSDSTITITNGNGVAGNPYFQVNPNTMVQQINVQNNGVPESTKSQINFIPGLNVGITVIDNPGNNSADIHISATPGSDLVLGTANQIVVTGGPPTFTISLATTLIAPGTVQVGNLLLSTNTLSSTNTNGSMILAPNGTGAIQLNNGTNVTPLEFYNSAGSHFVAFQAGTLSANTTWTLPTTDSTGTQSLVSNGSGTLSWSSTGGLTIPLPLSQGGTGANLTASNGGIFYSTASAGAILSGTATADQVLLSGSSTAPTWSTATYPSTITANDLLYGSASNVISGLASANSGTLVTSGSGVPSIQTLTAGQILIGTTASAPASATLTAGNGISIANASGSITISATNEGNWVNQNTSSATLAAGMNYLINNGASLVTLTLPSSPTLGDTYEIVGFSSGGWKVAQNASQNIQFGSTSTTAGTGGFAASANQYDCIKITYAASNTFIGRVSQSTGGITIN